MHVLMINTEKVWRGGERQTILSMEGLVDAGISVTLLCLKNTPLWQRALQAGFSVVGAADHSGVLKHLLFCGGRYSVIHAQSSRAFGFAALATMFIRTPLVYSRRVDFVPRGFLTRWKYGRAAALVAISGAVRNILLQEGMGDATVIGDIACERKNDPQRCVSLVRELGLEGRRIVGVVAALVNHKDPITMINAAALTTARLPETVFLHFGEGWLRKAAESEIRRLGLNRSYLLLGHREGVEDYFPLFDCFVMSSREEGLGSSVLDAFMAGVPVASTCAGGLAELVDKRGLVCPVGDATALSDNIVKLLTDRSLARSFASRARVYAEQYHSRRLLTGRYIEIYRNIISSPKRRRRANGREAGL